MEDTLSPLLTQWGFPNLINIFHDNQITTVEALEGVTVEDLEELQIAPVAARQYQGHGESEPPARYHAHAGSP